MSALKHWKESASLIFASRKIFLNEAPKHVLKNFKNYKEGPEGKYENLLRVLMLKRSANTRMMPNFYVFPGGTIDKSDFSKEWIDICKVTDDRLNIFTHNEQGSDIFSRDRGDNYFIPSEIALRITAIRETFEETGLLIVKKKTEDLSDSLIFDPNLHPIDASVSLLTKKSLSSWREEIFQDPSQFLVMCRDENIVPDICSLYEWSNWLTPLLGASRHDTAFFVCCVEYPAGVSINSNEADGSVWSTPGDILEELANNRIQVAPPQVYELARLSRLSQPDDLKTLAWKIGQHRCVRWFPVLYLCTDGILFVLPGDDLYPDTPDPTGEDGGAVTEIDKSFAELYEEFPHHNRVFLQHGTRQMSLHVNLDKLVGHILPISFNERSLFTT